MIFDFFRKSFKIKPVALIILDGFGLAPASAGNAIDVAQTPNLDRYLKGYPHAELIASGQSVGLPANEVGNTEVGHLTIGAGRLIPQDLMKINMSIESGTFYDNRALVAASNFVKSRSSSLHIFGLLSSGNVHSSEAHLKALLQFCKKEGLTKVYLHVFTDGRDAPMNEALNLIPELDNELQLLKIGRIVSISGRYYAMDRDNRWERIQKTYDAMTLGEGPKAITASDAIKNAYNKGLSDEFIEPTMIGDVATVKENDAIIFFNYRIDRAKELTKAFVMPGFNQFSRKIILKNIFFVTMTEYEKNIGVSDVAFGSEQVEKTLNVVLSEANLKQLHMSESEKERFVTYYFDGLRETRVAGEDVKIIASPRVATYDKKPEMSLPKLSREIRKQLRRDTYNFAVMNIANPDMVAHTGNLEATITAIRAVDKYLEEIVRQVDKQGGITIITADHGNAEELLTYSNTSFFFTTGKGTMNTDHSNNPVPMVIIGKQFLGKSNFLGKGSLADVAPTILGLMGIQIPVQMTGRNLLVIPNNQAQNKT